jgi:hypothetical protein
MFDHFNFLFQLSLEATFKNLNFYERKVIKFLFHLQQKMFLFLIPQDILTLCKASIFFTARLFIVTFSTFLL